MKKYKPTILNEFNYRGCRVREVFNNKSSRREFKSRFQINNIEYTPVADTKKELQEMIDDLRNRARRIKQNLEVPIVYPTLRELFDIHSPKIEKPHQQKIFLRVSETLLSLLPDKIKVNELKKAHFQKYIDLRRSQFGVQTKKPILGETIDKELYCISSALCAAPYYFVELDNYQKPIIPKAAKGKKRKRSKIVSRENELNKLLSELRSPTFGRITEVSRVHRARLADDLEFRFETGLRKKETELLKKDQYFADDQALRDVVRWKTESMTKFFPLSRRAIEILESRLSVNNSQYFFTDDGKPRNSDYPTLKAICEHLGIIYGRYNENGFVPHDFRRSFATDFIQFTDIETAREFLGHSNITQTSAYLRTNETRMRQAVNNRDGMENKSRIVEFYKAVFRRKMGVRDFIEKINRLN